jgi:hypothetical protein
MSGLGCEKRKSALERKLFAHLAATPLVAGQKAAGKWVSALGFPPARQQSDRLLKYRCCFKVPSTGESTMSNLWIPIATGLVLLGLGLAAWLYRRKSSSSLKDRYAAEPLIARDQVEMLEYLNKAFPNQVVAPNVQLRSMLSVRRSANRKQAEDRLNNQKVDFVVCGDDGRPLFAFDLEQYHLSDVKTKAYQAKVKNRILKTAGVRLVYVKPSISLMPTHDAFREQLNLAALPRPQSGRRATDSEPVNALEQLESHFSEFDHSYLPSTFKESEVLNMNGLAELDEMLSRPGSRRLVRDRRGPDSLQSGHSGFDGDTSDVRGG